jgi:hypothetical protein
MEYKNLTSSDKASMDEFARFVYPAKADASSDRETDDERRARVR